MKYLLSHFFFVCARRELMEIWILWVSTISIVERLLRYSPMCMRQIFVILRTLSNSSLLSRQHILWNFANYLFLNWGEKYWSRLCLVSFYMNFLFLFYLSSVIVDVQISYFIATGPNTHLTLPSTVKTNATQEFQFSFVMTCAMASELSMNRDITKVECSVQVNKFNETCCSSFSECIILYLWRLAG